MSSSSCHNLLVENDKPFDNIIIHFAGSQFDGQEFESRVQRRVGIENARKNRTCHTGLGRQRQRIFQVRRHCPFSHRSTDGRVKEPMQQVVHSY